MNNLFKHNFGAGPCILAPEVLYKAGEGVKRLDATGLSILEISHRSKEFEHIITSTEALVRELLNVPDDYSVLFLQGGASMQFCMVPMNFMQGYKGVSAYLDAGYFGYKALKEAELFGEVKVAATSRSDGYGYIPKDYEVPRDAVYFHCTSNNTIEGTEMFHFPDTDVPLVCDMSSDIFSREIDVRKFALIYAGAQKNTGSAGMTLVIARSSFLDSVKHRVPSMLDYRVYRDHGSMYNTPPVFAIYTAMLNLGWLKAKGGVKAAALENRAKAQLLYDEIDRNPLFEGIAERAERSLMNVTFRAKDERTEKEFLQYAEQQGMVGVRGYRAVGGFRASLYNALPYSSVQALVHTMRAYAENEELREVQTAN